MKKLMIATLIATSGWFMPAMAADTEATVSNAGPASVEPARRRFDLFDYRCTARSYGRGGGSFTARGETRYSAQRKALRTCERYTRGWNRCYITSCRRVLGFGW